MLAQELKLLLSQLVLAKKNLLLGCSSSSEAAIVHTIDIYTQGKRSRTRFCLLFCVLFTLFTLRSKRKEKTQPTQPNGHYPKVRERK
jgi:hypothetical protein